MVKLTKLALAKIRESTGEAAPTITIPQYAALTANGKHRAVSKT